MKSSNSTVPTTPFAALSLTQNSAAPSKPKNLTPHKNEDDNSTNDTRVSNSKNPSTQLADEEDGKLTLLQALDANYNQFEISSYYHNFSKEGIFTFRNIITLNAQEDFTSKKNELMQLRLQAFKELDWHNYAKYIRLEAKSSEQIMQEKTLSALNHLGISQEKYRSNFSELVRQDYQMEERIEEYDQQLKKRLDIQGREFVESKEEIKVVLMEKVKLEGELQIKLNAVQAPSSCAFYQIQKMESNKIMDSIYLKHGMNANYLDAIAQHHGLQDDDHDIKTLEQSYRIQAKQRLEQTLEFIKFQDEKVVDDVLKQLNLTEKVYLNASKLMQFNQLASIQTALMQISVGLRLPTEKEFQKMRRELLKLGEEKNYDYFLRERQQDYNTKTMRAVMQKLGLTEDDWERNKNYWREDAPDEHPELQKSNLIALKEIKAALLSDQSKKLLSKQDTIDYFRRIQLMKLDKIDENDSEKYQIDQLERDRNEMKVSDRLFNEVGATWEDIKNAMKKYEHEDSPELQAIKNEIVNEQKLNEQQDYYY